MTKYKYLFLDRDGVINNRLPGRYVSRIDEFQFADGALQTFPIFNQHFERIFVVTNQQGIGKGIMTVDELDQVHDFMEGKINQIGGKLDAIYYCPELKEENPFVENQIREWLFRQKNLS